MILQQHFSPEKTKAYCALMRINKPIGNFLLLWPTLTALWIAGNGHPPISLVIIFTLGVFVMRAAGCILNDFADRKFDKHVERTQLRPLTSGKVTVTEAFTLCFLLLVVALILVLQLNAYCIVLSLIAVALTGLYPFMKRFTHFPQVILGIAFNWGILMAFAAIHNHIPLISWCFFLITIIWTVVYDTQYAMVDRKDDLLIGIKSTAVLFGNADKLILFILQILIICMLIGLGFALHTNLWFYLGVLVCGSLMIYQQYLIKDRDPKLCFKAFLNNNWALFSIFVGLILSLNL